MFAILKITGLAGINNCHCHEKTRVESAARRQPRQQPCRQRGARVTAMTVQDGSLWPKAVLVLENDAEVRKSIMNFFINRGFDILESASPDEALCLVQQSKLPIGVAVVDMRMPVMWGDEFAERLALISPETKVIFISGHTEEYLQIMGSLKENDIFFPKPYSPRALLHKVWELLGMEVPVVPAAQGVPPTAIDPQPQIPHFAEHLDFHIENDHRVQ